MKEPILRQKLKRVLTAIIAFILVFGLTIPGSSQETHAASKSVRYNVSSSRVTGNYSKASLPTAASSLKSGSSYYFNMQTVGTWKATKAQLYVKAPGSSSYSCVGTETAKNYMTYVYLSYKFSKTGTYKYYWSVKSKDDGKTYKTSAATLTVSSSSSSSTTTRTGYTTNTKLNLNMRKSASSSATVIAKIPPLSTVTVYGSATNGFYKVKYNGTTGYVSSSYISFTNPSSDDTLEYYKNNVGKVIANIDSYVYSLDGGYSSPKQCVGYVRNRGYEKLKSSGLTGITGDADTWWSQAKSKNLSTGQTPKSNSIACFKGGANGHVIYVEYYDSSSQNVYFTEANCSLAKNGELQVLSLTKFKKHSSSQTFQGFIYLG